MKGQVQPMWKNAIDDDECTALVEEEAKSVSGYERVYNIYSSVHQEQGRWAEAPLWNDLSQSWEY